MCDLKDIPLSDFEKRPYTDYENSTYTVISKIAFLIGVPKRIFENEHEPPQMEWYEKLYNNKNARIVRNLSILRTAIEQNFKNIYEQMRYELKNLHSLPEYIPQDSLEMLITDGITIEKANCTPSQYIININRYLTDRINNCKALFPLWLKWDYVRSLFLMPNGLCEMGIKQAANE